MRGLTGKVLGNFPDEEEGQRKTKELVMVMRMKKWRKGSGVNYSRFPALPAANARPMLGTRLLQVVRGA